MDGAFGCSFYSIVLAQPGIAVAFSQLFGAMNNYNGWREFGLILIKEIGRGSGDTKMNYYGA